MFSANLYIVGVRLEEIEKDLILSLHLFTYIFHFYPFFFLHLPMYY